MLAMLSDIRFDVVAAATRIMPLRHDEVGYVTPLMSSHAR